MFLGKIRNRMQLNMRGDTVVEVLICLGVLGVILGSSTVIVNNSRKSIIGAQENAIAQRLVQSQLEQIQAAVAAQPTLFTNTIMTSLNGFCLDNTMTPRATSVTNPNPSCRFDRAGTSNASSEPLYVLRTVMSSSQGGYLLTTSATWDMPSGTRGTVTFIHRIYQ